jgi:hypothetical protein
MSMVLRAVVFVETLSALMSPAPSRCRRHSLSKNRTNLVNLINLVNLVNPARLVYQVGKLS